MRPPATLDFSSVNFSRFDLSSVRKIGAENVHVCVNRAHREPLESRARAVARGETRNGDFIRPFSGQGEPREGVRRCTFVNPLMSDSHYMSGPIHITSRNVKSKKNFYEDVRTLRQSFTDRNRS